MTAAHSRAETGKMLPFRVLLTPVGRGNVLLKKNQRIFQEGDGKDFDAVLVMGLGGCSNTGCCDVVLQYYAPGTCMRFGLAYESLRTITVPVRKYYDFCLFLKQHAKPETDAICGVLQQSKLKQIN